jgi:hypothetical protein
MTVAEEAQRYLAVVELFRAEGYEPHWRPETPIERAELSKSSPSTYTQTRDRRKSCSN